MASVAYNFMVVDPNSHSRRYSEHNSTSGHGHHDPRRSSHVALDMGGSEAPSTTTLSKRRRSRKKSSSAAGALVKERIKVQVCVQFFKVGEIDTLKEQYTADVIVRARWREPSLDGQLQEHSEKGEGELYRNPKLAQSMGNIQQGDIVEPSRYWNPKLYIENAYGDPKEQFRHRVMFNEKGEAFISEKRTVKGTFMENLELDDFPFDVQDLTITVASEFPASEVELVEDSENRHMVNKQSFVDEQEWHLYCHTECTKWELKIDPVDEAAKRSAISVKCRAARRPGYFVWNIFMVTFLICSLSFATFSVDKQYPQNRLQLSFTLMLTSVAFKSVVNQSLPRISYLTYMDKYLLASMIMLSAVCVWHAIVTTLLFDRSLADEVETIVLTVLGVVYLLFNVGFVIMIYLFPCKKRRTMCQKDREHKEMARKLLEQPPPKPLKLKHPKSKY
ncbi:cys-loop ligand-gated ion channel-like isoform X2 [Littorina saxatilis]|uniref:cys-loop ligand-gated ion channel-like isoform X2 n=1 Tax=Littorina saxatilis TaxID=31220 RepID=UPI0038B6442D